MTERPALEQPQMPGFTGMPVVSADAYLKLHTYIHISIHACMQWRSQAGVGVWLLGIFLCTL